MVSACSAEWWTKSPQHRGVGRGTAKTMIWEWGVREFSDDRLFPKLQLTTVTLGWAGHKKS